MAGGGQIGDLRVGEGRIRANSQVSSSIGPSPHSNLKPCLWYLYLPIWFGAAEQRRGGANMHDDNQGKADGLATLSCVFFGDKHRDHHYWSISIYTTG